MKKRIGTKKIMLLALVLIAFVSVVIALVTTATPNEVFAEEVQPFTAILNYEFDNALGGYLVKNIDVKMLKIWRIAKTLLLLFRLHIMIMEHMEKHWL